MFSSLWETTKINLTGKYEKNSVSNISHSKFIIYIRKFTTVNILRYISFQQKKLACIKVQLRRLRSDLLNPKFGSQKSALL